ncbi:repeat-containing protein [Candidatus Magnetomorum sp. HK-1]|nr:repeat-containing protein [Candidatus Magnetomorum sp. HK-1]
MISQYKYDVFIAYAEADMKHASKLSERLGNAGVKVFFDQWEVESSGDRSKMIKAGLKFSKKLVMIWSPDFFEDSACLSLLTSFIKDQNSTLIQKDRLLIPALFKETIIPDKYENLIIVDFREKADFELKIRQLIEAMDLPDLMYHVTRSSESTKTKTDDTLVFDTIGSRLKGFITEISDVYSLLNFEVHANERIEGLPNSFTIKREVSGIGGFTISAVVVCHARMTEQEFTYLIDKKTDIQNEYVDYKWISVTAMGYDGNFREELEKASFSCTTYAELLQTLIPLTDYERKRIDACKAWIDEKWEGKDLFIRPNLETDTIFEKQLALAYFARWLGTDTDNVLIVLGDLGTGKSTLAQFLFYDLARAFLADPLRHPAPILVPLKEVRKEVSLEGIIISHFAQNQISIDFNRFSHLVRVGKIIIFFDGFDEMADRVQWKVTQSNFNELLRAGRGRGKIFLTCRTHYFKDRREQVRLIIGKGPRLSATETVLYREIKQQSGAELVYLKEFSKDQIKDYLRRVRPESYKENYKKIQRIHNLEELAHRPLLLDLIVNSLPQLENHQDVNAANLYTIFTNLWIEREREKGHGKVIDSKLKLAILFQLTWQMWHEEKEEIHYTDLVQFLKQFEGSRTTKWSNDVLDDIFREMMTASFLKRDDDGNFSFMHRSFMEFFLARRLHITFSANPKAVSSVLNTRRFDRKIIFFLTLLDRPHNKLKAPLQKILTQPYAKNISENALQILYWSARIGCNMEDEIHDMKILQQKTRENIPKGIKLSTALLQEMVFEGADLTGADLSSADLTRANINHAILDNANLNAAKMDGVRAEHVRAIAANFRQAAIKKASFNGADLTDSTFVGVFKDASFVNVKGLDISKKFDPTALQPTVQRVCLGGVTNVLAMPDGQSFIMGTDNGLTLVYRLAENKYIWIFEDDLTSIKAIARSDDGKLVAYAGTGTQIIVRNIQNGKKINTLNKHRHDITGLSFSPDAKYLASCSLDHRVYVWEMAKGKVKYDLEGHTEAVTCVQFSPKGNILASGGRDKKVRLWNINDGSFIRSLIGHPAPISAICFSPDKNALASAGGGKLISLWSIDTGKQIRSFIGHHGPITAVKFSPDGSILVAACQDKKVYFWQEENARSLYQMKRHEASVNDISFFPDGNTIITASDDQSVRIWDVENRKTSQVIRTHSGSILSMDFSPNGKAIAAGTSDNMMILWSIEKSQPQLMVKGHSGSITSIGFSSDGKVMASGSEDSTIRIWGSEKGRTLHGHMAAVTSVCFLGASKFIASASVDRTVRLWNMKTMLSQKGHANEVSALDASPDGKFLASASVDKMIYVWNVQNKSTLHTLKGHEDAVLSLVFSQDGTRIASSSADRTVRIWDVKTGKNTHVFHGHIAPVNCVRFSPDGLHIASCGEDKTIRMWHPESEDCLAILRGNMGSVSVVSFAPNGKYLVAAGHAGRLQFWNYMAQETILYRYAFAPGAWLDILPDGRFDASPEGLRYLTYTELKTLEIFQAEELVQDLYDPKGVKEVISRFS